MDLKLNTKGFVMKKAILVLVVAVAQMANAQGPGGAFGEALQNVRESGEKLCLGLGGGVTAWYAEVKRACLQTVDDEVLLAISMVSGTDEVKARYADLRDHDAKSFCRSVKGAGVAETQMFEKCNGAEADKSALVQAVISRKSSDVIQVLQARNLMSSDVFGSALVDLFGLLNRKPYFERQRVEYTRHFNELMSEVAQLNQN